MLWWIGQGTAEDFADKACWLGSSVLFGLFAAYASTVMHWSSVLSPFRCLAPKEFNHAWLEHAETFCWEAPMLYEEVNRTAQMPYGLGVPVKNYLRWLPAVFAGIAVAMAAPRLLWRLAGRRAHELVSLGAACQWQPWLERSHATAYLADEVRRSGPVPCCLASVYLAAKAVTCGIALACLRLLGRPFNAVSGHPLGPAKRLLLDSDWQAGLMPGAFHCEYGGQLHVHHQHAHQLVCEFAHESLVNCLCIAGAVWLLVCALISGLSGLAWLVCLLPPLRRRLVGRLQRSGLQQQQLLLGQEQQLDCDAALLLMHVDAGVSGLLASDVLQQLARLVAADEVAAEAAAAAASAAAAAAVCEEDDQLQEKADQLQDSPTAATALLLSKTPVGFIAEASNGGQLNNNNNNNHQHHHKGL